MRKPHIHAAVIHAYADGAEIEWRDEGETHWHQCITPPQFRPEVQYRVKHEPPVRSYPETRLTEEYFNRIAHDTELMQSVAKRFANAALRHAIDNFQVVPTGIVEQMARRIATVEADYARTITDQRLTPEEIDRDAQAIFKNALAGEV